MRVIAVVGRRDTGKTTTIVYLVKRLVKEGFRVGVVKRIHHPDFTMDTPGKDTFRFANAGAGVVVSSAAKELTTIRKVLPARDDSLGESLRTIRREGMSLAILEGFHNVVAERRGIAKIVAARTEDDLREMLGEAGRPILAITGRIANTKTGSLSGIPVLGVKRNGDDLLSLIMNWIRTNQRHSV